MTIPRDVGFGLNDFQEMQVYSEGESIARYLSNILLMRPGNLPGLPHIGLNIKDFVKTLNVWRNIRKLLEIEWLVNMEK